MELLTKMDMQPELKGYLMNCDLEDLNDNTFSKYETIASERKNSEKYWRDRITAENS
jgi:hypothetical protein